MDVIPLDASLVKGSHGCPPTSRGDGPLLITQQADLIIREWIDAPAVHDLLRQHLGVKSESSLVA
jgi:hypothetical protein